jgi:hypothetical protein
VLPSHVFIDCNNKIGAIWFVAISETLNKEELGLYTESLYRFLTTLYSEENKINPSFCLAVDVLNKKNVSYQQIIDDKIPSILDSTIDDIKLIS